MNDKEALDLVILGGGLSGSRLVIELIDALLAAPRVTRAMAIGVVDRRGAFGGGIPYGPTTTRPGFLLIESAGASTPPEFREWLRGYRGLLADAAQGDDPALSAWARENEGRIAAERFDELFVPRRVFGRFVAAELEQKVRLGASAGVAAVIMLKGEATDVEPRTPFDVRLSDGRSIFGRFVVLATGCIPRRNDVGLAPEDGYVHDPYDDAYEGLRRVILARASGRGPIDVAVVGSSASASEVVYCIASSPDLLAAVRVIRLISVSGYLAGGAVVAPEPGEPGALAGGRPSAREYTDAAARLVTLGKLSATRARVCGVRRASPSRLEIAAEGGKGSISIRADVVINCAGVGRIGETDSPLLQNLAARAPVFKPNACRRGFELRPGTYEIDGADGCFVLGPLLNQDPLESQVESIHAVYRAAKGLAAQLLPRWIERKKG